MGPGAIDFITVGSRSGGVNNGRRARYSTETGEFAARRHGEPMPTIYEVAALAGVSPATVSRVFNGLNVSPEKSRLVREAAAELSFTPSRAARTLRRQHSEVIALLIPDIENPFFTSLARGVEDVAQEAGYSVVLCNTDEDPEKETKYLDIAISDN